MIISRPFIVLFESSDGIATVWYLREKDQARRTLTVCHALEAAACSLVAALTHPVSSVNVPSQAREQDVGKHCRHRHGTVTPLQTL